MVTITVTCYSWAPSSGDHLFTCGTILFIYLHVGYRWRFVQYSTFDLISAAYLHSCLLRAPCTYVLSTILHALFETATHVRRYGRRHWLLTASLAHACLHDAGKRAGGIPWFLTSAGELNCISEWRPMNLGCYGETSLSRRGTCQLGMCYGKRG